MRPNDPMSIDLTTPGTTCIAHASSGGGNMARWTELSVYRLPDGRYLSQVQGMTTMPGERTKTQRLASASLERVLKLFADSDIGIVAAETAREWAEQQDMAADAAAMSITDREALEHLYGKEPTGRKGFSGLVASDFGADEGTVRSAIANNRPIKVPLARVLPFIDRELLARVREMRDAR